MARLLAFVALVLATASISAQEPAKPKNPDRFCENAKELATITDQLPDYKLSSDLASGATLNGKLKFDPRELLRQARGQSVCIAVVVSETGAVQDAAVYYPKTLALSQKERNQLLAQSYAPAQENGEPVKSIVVMKAWFQ